MYNQKKKKAGIAILTLDEVDFRRRNITSDKEGHYIRKNRSIHQEYIHLTKFIYEAKNRASKYEVNTYKTEGRNR